MASKRNTEGIETPADNPTPSDTPATPATGGKGQPRPRAAVDVIDFSASADESELESTAGPRTSKWGKLLDSLYEATAADPSPVPRGDDGTLKFTLLGTFNNPGGARTQIKAFEDKELDQTYDFKSVVKGKQSFLWARVKEVADA